MATITQRPNDKLQSGDFKYAPYSFSGLFDSNDTTYVSTASGVTGTNYILLYYDFSSIPANAIITDISISVKYEAQGKTSISFTLCKDASGTGAGNYTNITNTEYSVYTTSSTRKAETKTFNVSNDVISAINSDIGILRTKNRLSLRICTEKVTKLYSFSLYDLPITITYSLASVISTNVSPSGSGTVSGEGDYTDGDSVTLTATPATGYKFVKWQKDGVDDGETSATRTITVSGDATYTAVFTLKTYKITTTVSPDGSGTVTGGGTYTYGSTATLTATPAAGYRFVKWQKGGTDDGNTSATRTIKVKAKATYTAVFEATNITVSFDASGGSVSTTSKTVTPGSTYGTLPTPTRAGYTFAGWYAAPPVYNGGFLRNNENIALGRTYMYTDKINVKIYAYMDDWSGIVDKNLISCTEGGGWGIGHLANTVGHGTEIYISGVGYKGIDFGIASLSSGWHCFDMVFDGSNFIGYVDGVQKGSVSTGGTAISYHSSNGIFIGAEAGSNATSGTGGYFNGSVGSVIIANENTRLTEITSDTIVSNSSAHTLYAAWKINHYTTTATCSNGTINSTTSYSSENPYGEQITLIATPNSGYEFIKWSDNTTSNTKTITVTGNNAYTAIFAFINKIFSGTNKLSNIYVGTTSVKAVYIGTTKIYEKT